MSLAGSSCWQCLDLMLLHGSCDVQQSRSQQVVAHVPVLAWFSDHGSASSATPCMLQVPAAAAAAAAAAAFVGTKAAGVLHLLTNTATELCSVLQSCN
jgi:hypothetical protein